MVVSNFKLVATKLNIKEFSPHAIGSSIKAFESTVIVVHLACPRVHGQLYYGWSRIIDGKRITMLRRFK
jgi:hypothetical protein